MGKHSIDGLRRIGEAARIRATGKRLTQEHKDKISLSGKGKQLDEKHPNWKGDRVSYLGLHKWIYRKYGKADHCENPSCYEESKTFDWALLRDKKYERKRENFWMLCRSCHMVYDEVNLKNK